VAKVYRLGVIGFAHMHVNTLIDRFNELDNVEWVACADTVPAVPSISMARSTRGWNLQRAQKEIGIPKVYADYREMLAQERLDIVVFCPENARHGEVAEAIATSGAHMITEKPMAATLSEALRMVRAARAPAGRT
jgi:predicted dehydrogenase